MPPSILILSACSGDKAIDPIVDCSNIDRWSRDDLTAKYPDRTLPARELYVGDEHEYVTEAVDRFARIADVDWRIVSAGFGLVRPETALPAYECTFRDMDSVRRRLEGRGLDPDQLTNPEKIQHLGTALGIPDAIERALETHPDIAFVVLGEDYLHATGSALESIPDDTTAFAFAPASTRDATGDCQWVPSTETEREALGTIWTRLKGIQLKNVAAAVDSAEYLRDIEQSDTLREMSLPSPSRE